MKAICGNRTAADFDPFEGQQTYGKKYERKAFRLADPKKRKWQAPHLFPKELWDTIGYNPAASEEEQPRKKIVLNKRATLDKLAKFDDDAEEGANGAADEDANEALDPDDDADEVEDVRDDEFEDDEDDRDDYNAEQYFDGGEDDYEDGGGDDYGGGDDGY
jgi:DNA-directed RNA polymerase III subunit RPC7